MLGSGYGGTPLALTLRAVCVSVVLVSLPSGCIFHLDDPVPAAASGGTSGEASGGDSGAGGAPSSGGSAGATSGGTSAGGGSGAAATGGSGNCQMGTKRCDAKCVQIDDPAYGCSPNDNECAKCVQLDSAKTSCASGKCVVENCLDGYGDCDGDDDNGCEIHFKDLPASGPVDNVQAVQSAMPINVDGLGRDPVWVSTANNRLPISEVCVTCMNQAPIPPVANPAPPDKADLQAWFRTAWDDFYLYVLVEVRDDDLVDVARVPPNDMVGMLGNSGYEDAVELLVSGDHSKGNYGGDDKQLFFGLDGALGTYQNKPDPGPPPDALFRVTKGRGCYTLELRLTLHYVAPNPPLKPEVGQVLGFTASVNDWDFVSADGGRLSQKQSHLFSSDPRNNYWILTDGFATLTLAGPPP